MNTIKAINDDKDKLKTLWNRIYELEAERQEISALFPDDATHKHEQTGESLYDNIQDALRNLERAKADLAAAREDVVRMRKQIADHEEAEASVCPEDVGFVEFIGVLQKRIAGLAGASNLWKKAAEAQHTMRQTTKPEKLDAALTWIENDELADKWLEEAHASAAQPQAPGESTANQAFLDAFSERDDWTVGLSREQVRLIRERLAPTPGVTDGERIDAVERLKLHVQYRDGSPPSVEKWAARNDAGMWTGSTAREAIDKALAAVRAERGGK